MSRRLLAGAGFMVAFLLTPALACAAGDPRHAFDAEVAAAKRAMMSDPGAALRAAAAARRLAAQIPDSAAARTASATAEWLQGEALTRVNRPSEALPLLQHAFALASNGSHSKLLADVLLARGAAEAAVGDVRSALGDYQSAYQEYTVIREERGAAMALQSVGDIYSEAGDDQRALVNYGQVAEIYHGDPAFDVAAHNNIGDSLGRLGRYAEAERHYRAALLNARRMKSRFLEARILTNIASTAVAQNKLGDADVAADRAIAALASGDEQGWSRFVWGVKAQIAFRRNDLATAEQFLARTFAGVDLAKSEPPFRDFHEVGYHLFERLGRYRDALTHLAAMKRLDDEARQLTASNSAALLAARFDFARQNLRISRLKEQQSRNEALLETSRAHMRSTVLSVLLVAAAMVVALLLGAFILIARSRNRVRAVNVSLTEANASLEKALRVKTDFLATTSHEIRTPLNGILGMSQVLLAEPALEPRLRERIEVVRSAGETMRALVDDILDVAKIESGRLTISRRPFDLQALLKDVAALWQDQCHSRGLTFEVDVAEAPGWIEEDDSRVRQIVFNLLSNAIKFTHEGAIRLRAGKEEDRLVIAVSDSGIGIPPKHLEDIFESFRQVDAGTSRRYGGTGLGLSICRRLAQAMGGDVRVESEVGRGSTFTLILPYRPVEQRESGAPATARPRATDLHDARLLIVNPNPIEQRMLANFLGSHVAGVDCTADGEAAAQRIAAGGFEHVLAELKDERGVEAAQALARAAREAGARLTVLHAKPLADSPGLLRLAPAQLIEKPISGPDLLNALAGAYRDAARPRTRRRRAA